jgi:hypothetical protein
VIPVCLLQSVSRKSMANAYWRDGHSLGIPTLAKHARGDLLLAGISGGRDIPGYLLDMEG